MAASDLARGMTFRRSPGTPIKTGRTGDRTTFADRKGSIEYIRKVNAFHSSPAGRTFAVTGKVPAPSTAGGRAGIKAALGPPRGTTKAAQRKRDVRARQKLNRALGAGSRFSGGQAG